MCETRLARTAINWRRDHLLFAFREWRPRMGEPRVSPTFLSGLVSGVPRLNPLLCLSSQLTPEFVINRDRIARCQPFQQ